MASWYYDPERERYRYVRPDGSVGRAVPWKVVRNDVFRFSAGVREDMRELTQMLRRGELTPEQWYDRMRTEMRLAYRNAVTVANGGRGTMDFRAWGRFGAIMKKEYKWLNNFLAQIISGKQSVNGRAVVRAGMYGNSTNRIYEEWRLKKAMRDGYTEAIRRLGATEQHCHANHGTPGCVELAGQWMPISEIVPIGQATCGSNCLCTIEYRNQMNL